MQGWRKSMEDAHVARTDVKIGAGNNAAAAATNNETKAKVFAVFDGHGGAEVARFCQMHLVDVLMEQDGWKEIRVGPSSVVTGADDGATKEENGELELENNAEDDPNAYSIGQALIHSFHALDRLIDDPSRLNEIERWRSERPPVYVHGNGSSSTTIEGGNDVENTQANGAEEDIVKTTANLQNLHLIGDLVSQDDYDSDESSGDIEIVKNDEVVVAANNNGAAANGEQQEGLNNISGENRDECNTTNEGEESTSTDKEEKMAESDTVDDSLNSDAPEGIINDDSSSSDDEKDSDDDEGEEPRGIMRTDAYTLISKLFMNGSTANDDDGNAVTVEEIVDKEEEETQQGLVIPTAEQLLNPPSGIVAPSASIPTKIMNGRKVCNLPDHPVHAGCTSVVAVIVDKTLVVANAGDSRAVLCRAGGLTEPLSFDHKPLQVSFSCACNYVVTAATM